MVDVRGRGDDRVNAGRLGPKGLFGSGQQRDRLLRALVRRGGYSVEADWDAAMDHIVNPSRPLLDQKRPLSHAFTLTPTTWSPPPAWRGAGLETIAG